MKKEYIIEEMTDEELHTLISEIEFQLADCLISYYHSSSLLDLRMLAVKELRRRSYKRLI